jgi:hypothetical protein
MSKGHVFKESHEEYRRVYLASFPRSGNHWVRYLIEEATSVATSSVYKERIPHGLQKVRQKQTGAEEHIPTPFPWGAYCTANGYEGNRRYPTIADPVVIKTHYPHHEKSRFDGEEKAICLIRNPIEAIYSYYVYIKTKGKEEAGDWLRFVHEKASKWAEFYAYWEGRDKVQIFKYEDLLKSPETMLSLILAGFGFNYTMTDVRRAVSCYPPRGATFNHRDYFGHEELDIIDSFAGDITQKHGYHFD